MDARQGCDIIFQVATQRTSLHETWPIGQIYDMTSGSSTTHLLNLWHLTLGWTGSIILIVQNTWAEN